MKGLLVKEFYVIRDSLLTLLVIFIAIGVGLAFLISPCVLITIAAITLSMQAITTIQNDKSTQWNRFSATLPVSRVQVVESKYLIYLLLSITGIALGVIICFIASLLKQSFDINELLIYFCLAIIISLLPGSISIPCAFVFDQEKSIMGTVLSYIVTSGLFAGLIFLLKQLMDPMENILAIYGITAAFSVVVFTLSWLLCPKRLSKRDI